MKLIAEPWDVGAGGYQLGGFPSPWAEWNDRYRDTVRESWLGGHDAAWSQVGGVRDLAYRLAGSSDLFEARGPLASVNFVTAHDGFTLHDLVSYNHKHNEANGEDNRDGTDNNHSWNAGVEGSTDDPEVLALRRRMMRNLLTTLLVSTGVPMLTAGDETGRTQGGNNNAYCDDESSWLSWDPAPWQQDLLEWTRALLTLRRDNPVLRHDEFFEGRPAHADGIKDLAWFGTDGQEMTPERWFSHDLRVLGLYLSAMASTDGRPVVLTARAVQLRPYDDRRTAAGTAMGLGVRRAARHQRRATGPRCDLGARRDRPARTPQRPGARRPARLTPRRPRRPGARRGRPWRVACRRSRRGAGRPPA